MNDVVSPQHQAAALRFKKLYSTYQQNRDLISVGAYQYGSDSEVDEAIDYYPRLLKFLQQDNNESVSYEDSLQALMKLTGTDQVATNEAVNIS